MTSLSLGTPPPPQHNTQQRNAPQRRHTSAPGRPIPARDASPGLRHSIDRCASWLQAAELDGVPASLGGVWYTANRWMCWGVASPCSCGVRPATSSALALAEAGACTKEAPRATYEQTRSRSTSRAWAVTIEDSFLLWVLAPVPDGLHR